MSLYSCTAVLCLERRIKDTYFPFGSIGLGNYLFINFQRADINPNLRSTIWLIVHLPDSETVCLIDNISDS